MIPNQRDLIRQMQQMQTRLAQMQAELGNEQVEGSAGGGAVKIVMDGHQQALSVAIDESAVDGEDLEMLQDLVLAAINDAVARSRKVAEDRMGRLTGGMRIPGLS